MQGVEGEAHASPLVGRLSPDRELARHAAFALFVLAYLEQVGLAPARGVPPLGEAAAAQDWSPAALVPAVQAVVALNPHVLAYFADHEQADALATLDGAATRELLGWLRAQRVDREEPQIAYELGMLALGVELPPIMVRALRQADVQPGTRVAELPDGCGYPTVFLSSLHPSWRAAECARLYVEGLDAQHLAGWATLLLQRRLAPQPGSIVRVSPAAGAPMHAAAFDLALVYNPVPWLATPDAVQRAVRADQVMVL